jgi:PAS domain-containing protein
VLDANPAYTQILGVPRDELLGTVPSLLRPTPADPLARQQRAAMWAGLRASGRLARRAAGAPPQWRDLHAAGHHLHGARAPRRRCATTCW